MKKHFSKLTTLALICASLLFALGSCKKETPTNLQETLEINTNVLINTGFVKNEAGEILHEFNNVWGKSKEYTLEIEKEYHYYFEAYSDSLNTTGDSFYINIEDFYASHGIYRVTHHSALRDGNKLIIDIKRVTNPH